ncbi:MAG: Asp-tRNA(Asn)/Glu-tRNA(Gln) amidotransferase subunit GatB [bacterium]|nr:Asp-tRNA(Asn)/Glu-tRNA(Gln) amidotransferase subunit GatB [bacterium]
MNYKLVMGLEVHVELATKSKMFCSCPANHFLVEPNTQTCPVCLGLPGALPVPNKQAIEWAQKLGAALECDLANESLFERKHYFYPDLPKGFQISQYLKPLSTGGTWELSSGRKITINRAHMEEDTGKLAHSEINGKKVTLVDYNRSGVPLVEIVTEPDFQTPEEAREYCQGLQQVIRYLEISDADMEKGSMRLEANVSLRPEGETELPNYRVELKNINSFRFLEKAINYEIKRQTELLEKGETIIMETRGYDEVKDRTVLQRSKEEAKDYRYFPEPDIPPFEFTKSELQSIKESLPELPKVKAARLKQEFSLSDQYANYLVSTRELADYFEEAVRVGQEVNVSAKKIADTLVNKKPDINEILPAALIEMLREESTRPGLVESELISAVESAIKENPQAVEDFKKGKEASIMFLVGQVMAKTKGLADAGKAKENLVKVLNE